LIYAVFYSFVNHVQYSFLNSGNKGMGTELPYLLLTTMSSTREENVVWTWNHRRSVVSVAFVLMVVVRPQPSFSDDRRQHQQVQAAVAKELAKEDRFQNLRVEGEHQTVKLRGAVALLEDKRQAIARAVETKNVGNVVSHIKVETENIPDTLLLKQLRERLAEGQNGQMLKVKKGVVTIQGTVHDVHREIVLSTVAGTPGVIGIKDRLQVVAD